MRREPSRVRNGFGRECAGGVKTGVNPWRDFVTRRRAHDPHPGTCSEIRIESDFRPPRGVRDGRDDSVLPSGDVERFTPGSRSDNLKQTDGLSTDDDVYFVWTTGPKTQRYHKIETRNKGQERFRVRRVVFTRTKLRRKPRRRRALNRRLDSA